MSQLRPFNKIAIIGHRGWVAGPIVRALAAASRDTPVRILHRSQSSTDDLPDNTETVPFSWENESSITAGLKGVDVLLSLIGHEGLHYQNKLIGPIKKAGVKLFAPSDLALPYTSEERATVEVPRSKEELEHEMKENGVPYVTILSGNFDSFALDSPYMGVDLPNNRIVHTGDSRNNATYLCSREYVAAAYVSLFLQTKPQELAGRTIGLNELRPTGADVENVMAERAGKPPRVAYETVEAMRIKARDQGDLAALVRKKMGDGTHGVGNDIWEVEGYKKKTIEDLLLHGALDKKQYAPTDDGALHHLDPYFT
ncbi:hypothetical protein FB567DRAFT_513359 [Paraphoma chrysanthemicola]|uniref:NmrA-like domain-containing protein n=1 Tax=Paraphoma chrysanthemicola TaxID=798071 RepID=A0A8K0RMA6_9PLEO|nr:hypothetical protein FB567DRAFT_513359 [Paraphoma chrysanthemicola]